MSLRGKKSLKILGGAPPPPPQKNHSGGGGERPFATPLSSPLRQKLPQIYTANHLPNTDTKNLSTDLGLFLPYVQEVVNPIYIVTHYINWSNYFLDAQQKNTVWALHPPPPRGAMGAKQKLPHPKKKKKKNPFFSRFR